MLLDVKNTKEEASSRHKFELSSSDSLGRSDNNYDDDNRTGAEDKNCYGGSAVIGDGGGDSNTGAGGGSAVCLRFLSSSALTEAFSAIAKSKAS